MERIRENGLGPGDPVMSGAELARMTGYAVPTCQRALRHLADAGVLVNGPTKASRLRVAGITEIRADREAAARELSASLIALRRAAGLTQPELAALIGVRVSSVGHAETLRIWQSREFWQSADAALGGAGVLVRLHRAYKGAANRAPTTADIAPEPLVQIGAPAGVVAVTVTWSDGSQSTVYPPWRAVGRGRDWCAPGFSGHGAGGSLQARRQGTA